jgi:Fur family ferric uptake transcriptional regulator
MAQTRQRAEVLEVLREGKGQALAAQELHQQLRAQGSRTGLATVYRTLHKLTEQGAVDVIREDPNQARYRLCSLDHHHHLICESCGKVVEIPECDVQDWAERVAASEGFAIRAHRAEIIGLCSRCTRAPAASLKV